MENAIGLESIVRKMANDINEEKKIAGKSNGQITVVNLIIHLQHM